MYKTWLLLWSIFICSISSAQVVEVKETTDLQVIGKQSFYFEDVSASKRINEVIQLDKSGAFEQHDKDVFAHKATASVFWFRFQTKNLSLADMWLDISTTYIWEIDIYAFDSTENKFSKSWELGSLRPQANKPYPTNTYWIPLQKSGDTTTRTFYIRAETGRSMEVPLCVGTLMSLEKNKDKSDLLTAGFVGALIVMFLYNSFLGIATRDKLYFFYVLYLFGITLSVTFVNNYPFWLEIIDNKAVQDWLYIHIATWVTPVQIPVALIAIYYLELYKYKFAYRVVLAMLGIIVLLGISGLVLPSHKIQTIHQLSVLLQSFISLIISYWLTLTGRKRALIYALGWTCLLVSILVYLTTINGYFPYNAYTRNAVYFGVILEIWFFSLALSEHIRRLRKENKSANKKLLDKARLEIEIRNQIIENQQLLEKANQESLVLRVAERERKVLRAIIDNLPIFVAMIDREGKYLVANKRYEEAFFLPINKIEGQHYSFILPQNVKEMHKPYVEKALKGEEVEFSDPLVLPNGQMTYSYGKYFPVFDKDKEVKYLTVFVTDISELKQKEAQLELLNTTKDKLFSVISHDLRSPFAQLKGILSIVEQGGISEVELKKFLPEIIRNVNYTSELLNNLVYWAKNQMSGLHAEPSTFRIGQLVENKKYLFEKEISNKELLFDNQVSESVEVYADENMIDLVLRNLIANAIKFCKKSDSILVQSEQLKQNQIIIRVVDTGIGIAQEDLAKLFGEEEHTTLGTYKEKGTGLGLKLCKEFVETNGGKIWVESEPQKGSIFAFSLPIKKF